MKNSMAVLALIALLTLAACGRPSTGVTPFPGTDIATEENGLGTEPTLGPGEGTAVVPGTGAVDAGRISYLIDFQLYGPNGEGLGSATDAVLNFDTNSVDYVLVDVDASGRVAAVPWSALTVNTSTAAEQQNSITFSGAMDQLSAASAFDANMMPPLGQSSPGWDAALRDFWGLGSADEMAQPTSTPDGLDVEGSAELHGVALASDFIGLSVQTADGQTAGTVDDLVIDAQSGEIQYVVLASTSTGVEAGLVAVPVEALAWNETESAVALTVDLAVFSGAPFYVTETFPDTQQDNWDAELRSYWQNYLVP